MKDMHNMTGDGYPHNFDGDLSQMKTEKKDNSIGLYEWVVMLIFLTSFFGCVYFYFENRTLKEEIQQKHLLIMDLGKLLERRK